MEDTSRDATDKLWDKLDQLSAETRTEREMSISANSIAASLELSSLTASIASLSSALNAQTPAAVRSLIEIQLLDLTKKLGAVMKKQTPAPVPGTATGRAFNDNWDGNGSDDDDASTEEHNDDGY